MAISTVGNNYGSFASNRSSYCPTCNQSASGSVAKTYSGYSGRTSTGDSYVCATCNRGNTTTSTKSNEVYNRSNSVSSYCPTCNKTHSATTNHWTGGNTGVSSSQTGTVYGTNWAK